MAAIHIHHDGDDRFIVRVRNHAFIVDQPSDVGGSDLGPTPTELFVAGLATCVGFYAERFFRRHDLSAKGFAVECDFTMSDDRPARVTDIEVRVTLPDEFPDDRFEALQRVVEHCTVHNSLRSPPSVRTVLTVREPV